MLKKLLIVAVSAATLALVSISAAFVVGGPQFKKALHDGDINIALDTYDGPAATRDFAFDASHELAFDIPVTMRFERSDTVSMKVEGPRDAIDDLVYEDGELSLKGSGNRLGDSLEVTITAPSLPNLRLDAPGDIELVGLDQDRFELGTAGAADVKAGGKVGALVLKSDGASDFDFEGVAARDATIEINGAGDIDLSATGDVRVEINGAGSVTLHVKPASVESEINGVGSVDHAY